MQGLVNTRSERETHPFIRVSLSHPFIHPPIHLFVCACVIPCFIDLSIHLLLIFRSFFVFHPVVRGAVHPFIRVFIHHFLAPLSSSGSFGTVDKLLLPSLAVPLDVQMQRGPWHWPMVVSPWLPATECEVIQVFPRPPSQATSCLSVSRFDCIYPLHPPTQQTWPHPTHPTNTHPPTT